MDLPQLVLTLGAALGAGGAGTQAIGMLRDRLHHGKAAPADETTARLDIIRQRDDAEHERDEANDRAARAGTRADTAEARADRLDRHISDLREFCIAHGTPPSSLPPRPALTGAAT